MNQIFISYHTCGLNHFILSVATGNHQIILKEPTICFYNAKLSLTKTDFNLA